MLSREVVSLVGATCMLDPSEDGSARLLGMVDASGPPEPIELVHHLKNAASAVQLRAVQVRRPGAAAVFALAAGCDTAWWADLICVSHHNMNLTHRLIPLRQQGNLWPGDTPANPHLMGLSLAPAGDAHARLGQRPAAHRGRTAGFRERDPCVHRCLSRLSKPAGGTPRCIACFITPGCIQLLSCKSYLQTLCAGKLAAACCRRLIHANLRAQSKDLRVAAIGRPDTLDLSPGLTQQSVFHVTACAGCPGSRQCQPC